MRRPQGNRPLTTKDKVEKKNQSLSIDDGLLKRAPSERYIERIPLKNGYGTVSIYRGRRILAVTPAD